MVLRPTPGGPLPPPKKDRSYNNSQWFPDSGLDPNPNQQSGEYPPEAGSQPSYLTSNYTPHGLNPDYYASQQAPGPPQFDTYPGRTLPDNWYSPGPPPPPAQYPEYPQASPSNPQSFGQPSEEQERGLMGALAGGAAGAYAGHKVHHGVLGALGGAFVGHKLEEKYKEHQKPPSPVPNQTEHKAQPTSHPSNEHHGNFSLSSQNISLDGDYDLIASCYKCDGSATLSSISLNQVLSNDDGRFNWMNPGGVPGNFAASARNVRLVDGGRELHAELRNMRGDWVFASVRLDEKIENSDGNLELI